MPTTRIPVDSIIEPINAHRSSIDNDSILELAASIDHIGQIAPILVAQRGHQYEVIAGHRRLLAVRHLGWPTIYATLVDYADGVEAEIVRATENLQRSQLTPVEEANIIYQLHSDHGQSISDIARQLGRSKQWVETRIDIAHMPTDVLTSLSLSEISIGHAQQLSRVTDDDHRAYLLSYARRDGVTVPILAQWVSEWMSRDPDGDPDDVPRPSLPIADEPVVIQIPCGMCRNPVEYRSSTLVRLCTPCSEAVAHVTDNPPEEP